MMPARSEIVRTGINACPPHLSLYTDTIPLSDGRKYKVANDVPNKETWVIDHCIKAVIPSAEFRGAQVNLWSNARTKTQNFSILTGLIGAASAGGAIIKRGSPMAIALGVISAVGFFFMAVEIYVVTRQTKQVEEWQKDPCQTILEKRDQAKSEGFLYVKTHNLKLDRTSLKAYITPEEVVGLYDEYFEQFCNRLLAGEGLRTTDEAQHQWLNDFTSSNPVSEAVLTFACGLVPEKYAAVSRDYEALHQVLTDVRSQFKRMRTERQNEAERILKNIETNRHIALAPFDAMKAVAESRADQRHSEGLRKSKTPEEKAKNSQEYIDSIIKYDQYYRFATAPVNAYFDGQRQQANSALREAIEQINRHEASAHAPYYYYARRLLEHARVLHQQIDAQYEAQPLPQNDYNIPPVPVPSAPPAEEDFLRQAAEIPPGMSEADYEAYKRFMARGREI